MVEIIPKKEKQLPRVEWIFLVISISIFIVLGVYSIYLYFTEKEVTEKIKKVEDKIISFKTPSMRELEEEILTYKAKISEYGKMLNNHYFYSKFFNYIETKIHPKVFFTDTQIEFENSKVKFSGKTENFVTLAQQMKILEEDPNLKVDLKEISLAEEGKVNFELEIVFNPEILK